MMQVTRAFTVRGPEIAYLIMNGIKNIENRQFRFKKGWIALHVGLGKIKKENKIHILKHYPSIPKESELKYMKGFIVGLVHISHHRNVELTNHDNLLKYFPEYSEEVQFYLDKKLENILSYYLSTKKIFIPKIYQKVIIELKNKSSSTSEQITKKLNKIPLSYLICMLRYSINNHHHLPLHNIHHLN